MGSVWNDGVQISRLSVDHVKLLGFQYGLLFELGTFGFDIIFYQWEQGLEEPIQEDLVIKLDLTQAVVTPPLMDMISDVSGDVLAIG